ncbi:MAG: putative manganese-dependent inorganic diphosphatase [Candidatus Bathyarchaeota archaeon]|nr:putative manganese-dependent inorganic diphosphatase [Candidatus Bathyarchaeota archaeon]
MTIYIMGHQNPDTDSICSAIAYANLKSRLGQKDVIPARVGKINKETAFVLDYFKAAVPELVEDVRSRASDVTKKMSVKGKAPYVNLRRVWETMQEQNLKTLPIVAENNYFIGLVTLGDLARKYLSLFHGEDEKIENVSLKNIIKTLDGKIILGDPNHIISGKVAVVAMAPESIVHYVEQGSIVIIDNRLDAQKEVIKLKPNLMIVTGNNKIENETVNLAKENQVSLICVPHDTYATTRLISMSVPASTVMKRKDIVTFYEDDLIEDIKPVMLETRYRNYPVLNEHHQIVGMITRYDLLALSGKKLILVDHNERSQAVPGVEEAEILEVIDHHRLGDVQTGEPIYFRNEPVGSTATIIANLFLQHEFEPDSQIAGLLCAAILSDTMLFKSPTCTLVDINMAKKMATIAGVEPKQFGIEMFKAGTSLEGLTAKELLAKDFKTFQMGDLKVGIGQVDTMNLEALLQFSEKLVSKMQEKRKEGSYDLVLMMLTDIYQEYTELLIVGDRKESVAHAFNGELKQNRISLTKVLSRKKQIIPVLTKFFSD